MARLHLYNGEPFIEDETSLHDINHPNGEEQALATGLSTAPVPEGLRAGPFRSQFDGKLVPRSDWQAIIQEMEQRKTRLSDRVTAAGIPHKDQGSTNYCWANGPVHAVEILRCKQGQKYVSLSPASIAAPIKNYRNVGGWGDEAMAMITSQGICPSSFWPDNAIDSKYKNDNSDLARSGFTVPEWWSLKSKTIDQLMTCLINRMPVAVGFLWWEHLVVAVDPVWVNGAPGIRIRNSWRNFGKNGYAIIQGQRMFAEGQDCPRVALAS